MNAKSSLNILLGLTATVILFHLALLLKVILYHIAWGGRLGNDREMYLFESVSILVNVLLGVALLLQGGYLKRRFNEKMLRLLLWCYFVLFVLNTLGNLVAKTAFEKSIAILTLVYAFLLWRVLRSRPLNEHKTS